MLHLSDALSQTIKEYQRQPLDRLAARGLIRGRRVLEIGCSADLGVARALAENGALEVAAINFFANDARDLPQNLTYVVADASQTPFPDGEFDTILAIAVVEHLRDIASVAREIARLLAPGGVAYVNGNPLWTSWAGHHVWVTLGDADYRFNTETNPVLPWEHLCYDTEGLRLQLLGRGVPTAHADLIVGSIYESRYNGVVAPAHASNKLSPTEILSGFGEHLDVRASRNRGGLQRMLPSYYFHRARARHSEEDLETLGLNLWMKRRGDTYSLFAPETNRAPERRRQIAARIMQAAAHYEAHGGTATLGHALRFLGRRLRSKIPRS